MLKYKIGLLIFVFVSKMHFDFSVANICRSHVWEQTLINGFIVEFVTYFYTKKVNYKVSYKLSNESQ